MASDLIAAVREVLEANRFGYPVSLASVGDGWNGLPFEERVRMAALLLRRELDPDEFHEVTFDVRGGGTFDPNVEIVVKLLPKKGLETVRIEFVLNDGTREDVDAG